MGPINLAKIKRAHEKLMRLDPDYAQRSKTNRCASVKKPPLRIEDSCNFLNAIDRMQQITNADANLERIGAGLVSTSRITAAVSKSKPSPAGGAFDPAFTSGKKTYAMDGQDLSISQLALRYKLQPATIRYRLKKGMTVEQAVSRTLHPTYTFTGKTLTLPEWSRHTGIRYETIVSRLKAGWSLEATLSVKEGTLMGTRSHRGAASNFLKPTP